MEATPATQVVEAPPVEEDIAVRKLRAALADVVLGVQEFRGQLSVTVDPSRIVEVCRLLKTDRELQFDQLIDITVVDYLSRIPRFDVVYQLLSHSRKTRLRLKAPVSEGEPVLPSVTPVWRSANFSEREAFDLFGIRFAGHPDLRRILMPEHWEGYPLRQDHPVGGEEVGFTS